MAIFGWLLTGGPASDRRPLATALSGGMEPPAGRSGTLPGAILGRSLISREPRRSPPPRPARDPRHRCVPEADILARLALDGWPGELADGRAGEARAGAARALGLALAAGAGFARDARGGRLFDFIEVEDLLEWLAETGRDPLWRDRPATARRTYVASTRAGERPAGKDLEPAPTRFRLRLSRRFDLARFAPGTPLRLRLPTPLPSAYHQAIAVTPILPPGLDGLVSCAEGRMEVRLRAPDDPGLILGADITFTAVPPAPGDEAGRLSGADREAHLRPFEDLIGVTPRIVDLAGRLARGAPPLEAVAAFWSFLVDGFHFRSLRCDDVEGVSPCEWSLDHRAYDCRLAAALLVALCRAHGLPARTVSGHYLSRLCPANHSWAEIWIDGMGWLPADILHHERDDPRWRPQNAWWEHFRQRWDYRLVFERPPRHFTGPMSARLPRAWQIMQTPIPGGLRISYRDLAGGALIYADDLRVDWSA